MEVLLKETIAYCKSRLHRKGGCGTCELHVECTTPVIVSKDSINSHIKNMNEAVRRFNEKVTQ